MVDGDAGRRNSQVFSSYHPVWNTSILTILWVGQFMDNDDVITLSSACLEKLWGLLFQRHSKPFHQQTKLLALWHGGSFVCFPIIYALSMQCRNNTRNTQPTRDSVNAKLLSITVLPSCWINIRWMWMWVWWGCSWIGLFRVIWPCKLGGNDAIAGGGSYGDGIFSNLNHEQSGVARAACRPFPTLLLGYNISTTCYLHPNPIFIGIIKRCHFYRTSSVMGHWSTSLTSYYPSIILPITTDSCYSTLQSSQCPSRQFMCPPTIEPEPPSETSPFFENGFYEDWGQFVPFLSPIVREIGTFCPLFFGYVILNILNVFLTDNLRHQFFM